MKKITVGILTGLLLIFCGVISPLQAQDPGWQRHGMREQREKNLENLRLLKLMEVLELTDEQSPQFISAFVDFRKEMRLANDVIQKETDSLASLLQTENPSDDAIKVSIARIESLKGDRLEKVRKFHGAMMTLLTPVQMGKLIVFEERFDRELIENVRGFRAGHMPSDSMHEDNR